jgi:hypothetical protein
MPGRLSAMWLVHVHRQIGVGGRIAVHPRAPSFTEVRSPVPVNGLLLVWPASLNPGPSHSKRSKKVTSPDPLACQHCPLGYGQCRPLPLGLTVKQWSNDLEATDCAYGSPACH